MITKYRKKPVVIEAVQYTGDNTSEIFEWMRKKSDFAMAYMDDDDLIIVTMEGNMVAHVGNFIICGIANEFYPCDYDIFAKTYEVAEHDSGLKLTLEEENARLRSGIQRFGTLLTEDRDESGKIDGIESVEGYLEPGDNGWELALWLLGVEYDEQT